MMVRKRQNYRTANNALILKLFIVLITSILTISIYAREPQPRARIDIIGKEAGIALKPGEISGDHGSIKNYIWLKNPKQVKQNLCTKFPATQDWKKSVISFIPDKDGIVTLRVSGAWHSGGTQTWTLFDDIRVKGTELKNGTFEHATEGWKFYESKDGQRASLSNVSKDGKMSLKVSYNCAVSQKIAVKANHPVIISFWFKAAK